MGDSSSYVKFAVMNVLSNEVEGFTLKNVSDLPLIFLYKKDGKGNVIVLKYEGSEISAKNIEEFVRKNMREKNERSDLWWD